MTAHVVTMPVFPRYTIGIKEFRLPQFCKAGTFGGEAGEVYGIRVCDCDNGTTEVWTVDTLHGQRSLVGFPTGVVYIAFESPA